MSDHEKELLGFAGINKNEPSNKVSKPKDYEDNDKKRRQVSFLENDQKVIESLTGAFDKDENDILKDNEYSDSGSEEKELVANELVASHGVDDVDNVDVDDNLIEPETNVSVSDKQGMLMGDKLGDHTNLQHQVIPEEDEADHEEPKKIIPQPNIGTHLENSFFVNKTLDNFLNNSNNSNIFQSKIMDFSMINRSQQRLSPIHINNRKYPIIDYMNESNNPTKDSSNVVVGDRSIIITSPSKKHYSKNSLLKDDDDELEEKYGVLVSFFKRMKLDYFDELPEFLSNEQETVLLADDFYKQNNLIKLFISNEDLHNISQETIYLSLYTKTPMLEIDRFIINELNSKLQTSLVNFNKINSEYNDPENKNKLPFVLQNFKALRQDSYYFAKLVKLLAVMKSNCDLESQKIWLNWRIQQFEGISLVLRDNLLIVKEQQKELDVFKRKLNFIILEIKKLQEIGIAQKSYNIERNTLSNGKIQELNSFKRLLLTKDSTNIVKNVEKWELKRQLLLKKYDIDIGEIEEITSAKQSTIMFKLREKMAEHKSNKKTDGLFKKEKSLPVQEHYLPLIKFLKKKNLNGTILSNNNGASKVSIQNITNIIFLIKFQEKKNVIETIEIDKLTSIEDTGTDFEKFWVLNESKNVVNTLKTMIKVNEKIQYLVQVSTLFKRLHSKYLLLKKVQVVQNDFENGLIYFDIWLNNHMGYIKVILDWSKFKAVAVDEINLLSEVKEPYESTNNQARVGAFLYFYGEGFDWESFLPKYVTEMLNWSI